MYIRVVLFCSCLITNQDIILNMDSQPKHFIFLCCLQVLFRSSYLKSRGRKYNTMWFWLETSQTCWEKSFFDYICHQGVYVYFALRRMMDARWMSSAFTQSEALHSICSYQIFLPGDKSKQFTMIYG